VSRPPRTTISVYVDSALLEEARAISVDINQAAEAGLRDAILRAAEWKRENAAAIESSNRYVEEHGLPLERYRQL
jgi:antitoxin CcdA